MILRNESTLDRALVEVLVRWVVRLMDVQGWVRAVRVLGFRGSFRGRCSRSGLVRVWVGPPKEFPLARSAYRAGAPEYELADQLEALVAILGHEFGHARQFMARAVRQSEVECERQALWVLTQFREHRGKLELEAGFYQRRVEMRAELAERLRAASAEQAPARLVAELEGKVKEWSTREKRARTWRLKYERRLTRTRKSLEGGTSP